MLIKDRFYFPMIFQEKFKMFYLFRFKKTQNFFRSSLLPEDNDFLSLTI